MLARIIPPERHPSQPLVDGCQRLLALSPFVARLPVGAAATLDVDVDRFGSSAVTSKLCSRLPTRSSRNRAAMSGMTRRVDTGMSAFPPLVAKRSLRDTLAFGYHEGPTPTHGYEATCESAMAAFAKELAARIRDR